MIKIIYFAIIFDISYALFGIKIRPAQSVSVKGEIRCNGRPNPNVSITMYDHDIFTADDFMGNGTTNSQGQFSFGGTTNEFFEIEPRIHIYHDCNDGTNTCQRKLTIVIPKKYISYSSTPSQYLVYDTGIIELTNISDEESHDCIHSFLQK